MDVVDEAEMRLDAARAQLSAQLRARVVPSGADECEDCGTQIPHARKMAAPFAARCIHCQEIFERSEHA